MAKVKIVSDSSCDLTPYLIQKYDIDIVPFYINLGDKAYRDGIDTSPQDIYDFVEKNGVLPGTIACSAEDYHAVFEKWRALGYEIICHTISSEMSSSCQNANIAADEVGGVTVIDSRNLSTGVGHLVLNSALMAQNGLTAAEIAEKVTALVPKVRSSFILDNLDYMKKGGRCSSVVALGANLLKLKPMISVENGNMKVVKKFRGPLKKVLLDYVDFSLSDSRTINTERLFITHTKCDREIIDAVRERALQNIKFNEVLETEAGATVTSHCGPNTLGILFLEK